MRTLNPTALSSFEREQVAKAAILLGNRKRWAQHDFAYDAKHRPVEPDDPQATCWCAAGALLKVGGDTLLGNVSRVQRRTGGRTLSQINDFEGYDAVVTRLWEIARGG